MKKSLAIYGTGGSGKEVYEMILDTSLYTRWKNIVFIDDTKDQCDFRDTVSLPFDMIKNKYNREDLEIVIAVGEPDDRELIANRVIDAGYNLSTIISPNARVSKSAVIHSGVVVRGGTIVSADAEISMNTYVASNSIVGHDVIIGKNCQISSFAMIAGNCDIGDSVFVGASSCVREKISIGSHSIISMGAVVLKDVDSFKVVMGNPARTISDNHGVFHIKTDI